MASTTFGVNDPLAVKIYSKRMDVVALKETQCYEFMGAGAGSLCQEMTETRKGSGDTIKWGIRQLAVGEGTTENETQEGNEEGLTRYTDQLVINELGHAHRVKNEGTIDRQRVPYDLREEAGDSLRDWWADRFDETFFNQLCGYTPAASNLKYTGFNAPLAPSSDAIIRGGSGLTTDQAVGGDATAVFKLSMIDRAMNKAKTRAAPIRPIKGLAAGIDYVCFIHPDQVLSLRADTSTAGNWFDLQGKMLQGGQGRTNGLFTGALGVYNRTLLVEAHRVTKGVHSSNGTAVTNTRRAVFCGAQAAALAFGKNGGAQKFNWVEELFDYERELGVRASTIFGMKKTQYNSVDNGTIVITTYAAPAS